MPGFVQANLLVGLFYLFFVTLVALALPAVAPIFPSSAVAMFAALIVGWRGLPGMALASWRGHDIFMDWSSAWSLWITLGNVLAPAIGALILRRVFPDAGLALESGKGVTLFAGIAFLSSALSAAFGGLAIISDLRPDLAFNHAFFTLLVADLASGMMLTPALVLWWRESRQPCQLLRGDSEMWLAA